jgi:predicted O-methyltransferase YrrM
MFGLKTLLSRVPYVYERKHGVQAYSSLWFDRRADMLNIVRPGGTGIELGVAEAGLSSQLLAKGVLGKLYGVDKYEGERGHDEAQYARARTRTAGYRDTYTLLKMSFDEALALFPDNSFDFVYVDGYAHTGQENGHTIRTWYRKVRSGGVISGDDFSREFPLVMKQVKQFTQDEGLTLNILAFRNRSDWASHHPSWLCIKP